MSEHDRGPTHVVGARFGALADARATLDAIRHRLRRADLDADVRPLGTTDYANPVAGALLGAHLGDGDAAAAIEVIRASGGEVLVDDVRRAPELPRWDEARPAVPPRPRASAPPAAGRTPPHRIRGARQQFRPELRVPDVKRARRRSGERARSGELRGLRVFRNVRELRDAIEAADDRDTRDGRAAVRDGADPRSGREAPDRGRAPHPPTDARLVEDSPAAAPGRPSRVSR